MSSCAVCGYRPHLLIAATRIFCQAVAVALKAEVHILYSVNVLSSEYLHMLLPGLSSYCFELFRVFFVSQTDRQRLLTLRRTVNKCVSTVITMAVNVGFACVTVQVYTTLLMCIERLAVCCAPLNAFIHCCNIATVHIAVQ